MVYFPKRGLYYSVQAMNKGYQQIMLSCNSLSLYPNIELARVVDCHELLSPLLQHHCLVIPECCTWNLMSCLQGTLCSYYFRFHWSCVYSQRQYVWVLVVHAAGSCACCVQFCQITMKICIGTKAVRMGLSHTCRWRVHMPSWGSDWQQVAQDRNLAA